MTTSGTSNYNTTRDQIITRALRIVQAIGQGETPDSAAVSDASFALNDLLAEWNTDGMPQWNMTLYTCTPLVSGTTTYDIGVGQVFNFIAPLKIFQAYMHDTTTNRDTPIILIDRQRYLLLGDKTSSGIPNQLFYQTPRAIQSGGTYFGELTLYPVPNTYVATNMELVILGQKPFDDFDAAGDTLDLPPYWINALVWGLAAQLAYEYGVGLAERSMITKKAAEHKEAALSFGTEEGSMYLMPEPRWDQWDLN
jgi:hypothetical protein